MRRDGQAKGGPVRLPEAPRFRPRGVAAVLAPDGENARYEDAASAALGATRSWHTEERAPLGALGDLPKVPVVICLWRRHHRLPRILEMLARQKGVRCELYLWNNDQRADGLVENAIRTGPATLPMRLATSEINIGGFGRFFWAREIAKDDPLVVFLDDDQMLGDDCLATFHTEYAERGITACWAFQFANRRDYWNRVPTLPGRAAKYCGTGGMVADTTVFLDPRLFRCPPRYWMCEDLWLSYFASTALGWSLSKSAAEVGQVLDASDQFLGLQRVKSEMFRHLNRHGGWVDPSG